MSDKIILFENKDLCSGCGACVDICHRKAIILKENEYGFKFPVIDESRCVHCGLCKQVCGFQNEIDMKYPLSVKAATAKNDQTLMKSTSGGVFAELAMSVLSKGGVVFGAAMYFSDGIPSVKHIKIESETDLNKLQGSKYVQSDCQGIYGIVKKELSANKTVLFSGTPCQIASLRRFVGNMQGVENLILVDIVCHGVPSLQMFQDYMSFEKESVRGEIIDFKFRDKNIGWGNKGSIHYVDNHGNKRVKKLSVQLSSYYFYFENGDILRSNCNHCPFCQEKRVSDITIGDYWGFSIEHPKQLKKSGGTFEEEKGISCVLVNTEKGKKIFTECSNAFVLCESTIDQVAKVNLQLKHPVPETLTREKVMEMYRKAGYKAIDDAYYKKLGKKKYIYIFWNMLPQSIRSKIKRFG